MRRVVIGLILGSMSATTALAEDVVEIRHKALKDRGSYPILYWCLEKDQIPVEYANSGKFIIADKASPKGEGGFLIASQPDYDVFLTTESCLEETIAAYTKYGGTADDLTITKK